LRRRTSLQAAKSDTFNGRSRIRRPYKRNADSDG